jgi:predicted transcriptional regulator
MASDSELRVLVAQVAAAYFSNSHVSPSEIPGVLGQITAGLKVVDEGDRRRLDADAQAQSPAPAQAPSPTLRDASEPETRSQASPSKPSAAEIRGSIRDDGLVSFEDGRRYKTLKRHLTTRGLTPTQYREKWGLPDDYPMVCASSSAKRSALAKEIGLGRKDVPRVRKAVPSPRMGKTTRR